MKSRQIRLRQARDARPAQLRQLSGFALRFGVCLLLGLMIVSLPPMQALESRFSRALVSVSHGIIGVCGGRTSVDGAVLRSAQGFAVEMKDGCNAVNVTILLWAAVIAFPAPWKEKLLGAVGGSLIIQAVNIVRFITLFYIGQYSMLWFDFAHNYLWETLIVLDTIVIFWLWVSRVAPPAPRPNAHA